MMWGLRMQQRFDLFLLFILLIYLCEWILTTSYVTRADVKQANEDGCPAHHYQLNDACFFPGFCANEVFCALRYQIIM